MMRHYMRILISIRKMIFYSSLLDFTLVFFTTKYPDYNNDTTSDKFYKFVNYDTLKEELENIDDYFNVLVYNNVISNDEHEVLSALKLMALDNANGVLSNEDYYTQINALKENTENLQSMILALPTIEIGIASAHYWVETGHIEDSEPNAIAPWVASDLAGGLVGGTIAGIESGGDGERIVTGVVKGAF